MNGIRRTPRCSTGRNCVGRCIIFTRRTRVIPHRVARSRAQQKVGGDHRAEHLTSEDLLGVFGGRSRDNIGVVLRPPFVAVDIDSKADNGQSVQKWLQERPHLIHVPRERTAGGAHLHFICPDLPEALLNARKALVQSLNDNVTAELYTSGLNLVVAPSVHKSGHRYTWEVTGEIPEVKWGVLAAWFDFALPEKKKPGGRWKPAKWWLRY